MARTGGRSGLADDGVIDEEPPLSEAKTRSLGEG